MARGRMLGKRLSTSQRYARLHELCPDMAEFAQSLYPLLVAHSDDFGRQQGDVFTVKHQVHPTSPRALGDFERALTAIHETGLIHWYDVAGRRYIQIAQFDEHQIGLHKRRSSEFPECPGISGNPPEIPAQEKRREEKGTELKRTEVKGTEPEPGASALPPDVDPADLMLAWNNLTSLPIPRCRELTAGRRRHAQVRLKERPMPEWRAVIQRINASDFCKGMNDRGWMATFDWLLMPDTATKTLEGKYDNRSRDAPVPAIRPGRGASNAAAFDQVADQLEARYARENRDSSPERSAEVAVDRAAGDGRSGNIRRLPDRAS